MLKKHDNQEFENVQLKQQLNTIQAKGANMAENNEPIQTQQAVQQWEYMSSRLMGGMEELKKLGDQGWEVVDGLRMDAGRKTVFKRQKQRKKNQIMVTVDNHNKTINLKGTSKRSALLLYKTT